MLILGIESSCDDTGAALVMDGKGVLSSVVSSQDFIHSRFGGIVPELASRRHIEVIIEVVEQALKRAEVTIGEVDAIGVTQGPGLVGSILIGLNFAKALAYVKRKPIVGVNHIEAHALSVFLNEGGAAEVPAFPYVALVVSGGHSALLLVHDFTEFTLLGSTLDDSAGEAFDKVSKLLGLGYPGGAAIDGISKDANPHYREFKRPLMTKGAKGNLDFSFSGLKTAVLNCVKDLTHPTHPSAGFPGGFPGKSGARPTPLPTEVIKDIAASFQEAVVDVLVEKASRAIKSTGASALVCAGGVACNSLLRERLKNLADGLNIRLFIPSAKFCTDNGAMVALTAYHFLKKDKRAFLDMGLDMNARPDPLFKRVPGEPIRRMGRV